MKKIAVFLLFTLAVSCGPATNLGRSVQVYFADYRPYSESGFFISPDPYSAGPFESLGELYIRVTPGRSEKGGKESLPKNDDGIYSRPDGSSIVIEDIKYGELLDIAVSEATALGADGLADFKITPPSSNVPGGTYIITGLCIKRH